VENYTICGASFGIAGLTTYRLGHVCGLGYVRNRVSSLTVTLPLHLFTL